MGDFRDVQANGYGVLFGSSEDRHEVGVVCLSIMYACLSIMYRV